MKHLSLKSLFSTVLLLLSLPKLLFGYIGPGMGLTAIGTLVACVVGIIVTIIGFLWYPIKRMIGGESEEPDQVTEDDQGAESR